MADEKRIWAWEIRAWEIGLGALLLAACAGAFAQIGAQATAAGSLAGNVTDLRSAPLAGVTVIARNQATGAEVRSVTGKNGAYRFAALRPGLYSLEAVSARLGVGLLEDIEVDSGSEARVQAAMAFTPAAPGSVAAPVMAEAAPASAVPDSAVRPPTLSARAAPAISEIAPPALPAAAAPLSAAAVDLGIAAADMSTGAADMSAAAAHRSQAALPSAPPQSRPIAAAVPAQQPVSLPPDASVADRSRQLQPRQIPATMAALAPAPLPPAASLDAAPPAALLSYAGRLGAASAAGAAAGAALLRGVQAAIDRQPSRLEAAAERPSPATAAVTTTVTAAEVQALPVSGRRWQDFLLDTSTAATAPDSARIAMRGSGQDPPDTTIDGASTRLAFGGAAGSGPGSPEQDPSAETSTEQSGINQGWSGDRGLQVSEAAVREVRIEAGNVEAEGAHAAGGRAGVETESGENDLHGQGFGFDRENQWGAQNPFTQWVRNTGTAAAPNFSSAPYTPPDHQMSWGTGMGGRIRRNQLFWFAALDANHRNDPGLAAARNFLSTDLYGDCVGFFCAPSDAQVLLLSAQLAESQGQALNDYMGVPRAGVAPAGLEQLAGLLGPGPRVAAQWIGFGRIDWQATERQRFALEGIGSDWNSPGGGMARVSENYGNHSFGSGKASQEWLLARWEAFLTPNLLTVTQVSAGREIIGARPDAPSSFEQAFLNGNSYGQLPQIVVDSRYGFTIGNPARFGQGSYPDERLYHGQEMVDWVRGKLLVKTGFEVGHNSDATSLLRNQTGSYYYSKVENFISDALAFQQFGVTNLLNFENPHNCNGTGKSLGSLPCYSYFSQVIGPTYWRLSTDDWASYTTAQWQLNRMVVLSGGLRWEREQAPAPIAALANPALNQYTNGNFPAGVTTPLLGNQWGPRVSVALGSGNRWPVLRLGYGMYFGRTENATLETALTQTGSLKGDLDFFVRPTDGLDTYTQTSSAPPFPSALTGPPASVVTPGAIEYAANFRNPEVHQAVVSIETQAPGRVEVTGSAVVSLGRRLPVSIDTNFNPAANPQTITYAVKDPTGLGPIKTPQITVPFYASWPAADCPGGSLLSLGGQCGRANPNYQQIAEIMSRANSTYEAVIVKLTRYGGRGLSFHAQYTYAHAMDWNPDESTTAAGSNVLDPEHFSEEYGTGNLDVRHSAAVMAIFEPPWKLRNWTGRFGNGWMLSGVGQFHTGLPYSMRTSGSIPEEFDTNANPSIVGLGPGMNGSGGDNRVYGVARNAFRYPQTWKADLRLGKSFDIGEMRQLELLAESFNLFNHENVTEIETTGYSIESGGTTGTLPTLCYLTINVNTGYPSCQSGTTTVPTPVVAPLVPAFGQPLNINGTDFFRERQIQFGARFRF